jgi:hypothetical protein
MQNDWWKHHDLRKRSKATKWRGGAKVSVEAFKYYLSSDAGQECSAKKRSKPITRDKSYERAALICKVSVNKKLRTRNLADDAVLDQKAIISCTKLSMFFHMCSESSVYGSRFLERFNVTTTVSYT